MPLSTLKEEIGLHIKDEYFCEECSSATMYVWLSSKRVKPYQLNYKVEITEQFCNNILVIIVIIILDQNNLNSGLVFQYYCRLCLSLQKY